MLGRYKSQTCSGIYKQEQIAHQKLSQQPQFDKLINEPSTYQFLQVQDQFCYSLLREQNSTALDLQCKQFTVMSNSGHGKTVETMCEQLEINPVKQTVPHCFILMPVVIGLQLGTETYHLDSEMWKR